VLGGPRQRCATYRDSVPRAGGVGPVVEYHKRRSVQGFGESESDWYRASQKSAPEWKVSGASRSDLYCLSCVE
jgi:hypothetical protein